MSDDDYRTRTVKVRVTNTELTALRERCPRGSLAPWLRQLGLGQPAPARQPEPADPALLRQLAGIGNNLNQIARRLNTGELSAADRVELLATLRGIETDVRGLRDDHEDQ